MSSMTRLMGFRDQPRAALPGEIGPEPLALHTQAVLQLRQGEDVEGRPHPPPHEAAYAEPTPLPAPGILSPNRHVALFQITGRPPGPSAPQVPRHQLAR